MSERGVRKLEEVSNEGGYGKITIDTHTGVFKGIVVKPGRLESEIWSCEGKDLQEVRSELREYLLGVADVKWEPVILIGRPEAEDEHHIWRRVEHKITLEYSRAFTGKTKSGKVVWKDLKRDDRTEEALNCTEIELGNLDTPPYRSESIIIPYTPSDWSALRLLSLMIKELNAKLNSFLKNKAGIQELLMSVTGGSRLTYIEDRKTRA